MVQKSQKGFTLLELVIVIIIVGVLASLALPRFFDLIESSRATEALVNIKVIREAMERCSLMSGRNDYFACDLHPPGGEGTLIGYIVGSETVYSKSLDIDDPDQFPNAHFTYLTYPTWMIGVSPPGFIILAFRNTRDGGEAGVNNGSGSPTNGIECHYEGDVKVGCKGYGKFKNVDF